MKYQSVWAAYFAAATLLAAAVEMCGIEPQPWITRDSVSVRYYGTEPFGDPEWQKVSPDGSCVVVFYHEGELATDSNRYVFSVYSIDSKEPRLLATWEARDFGSTFFTGKFATVEWSSDGSAVVWRGLDEARRPCVCIYRWREHKLIKVPTGDWQMGSLKVLPSGLLFSALRPVRPEVDDYPSIAIARTTSGDVRVATDFGIERVLVRKDLDGNERIIGRAFDNNESWNAFVSWFMDSNQFWVSPNGKWAIWCSSTVADASGGPYKEGEFLCAPAAGDAKARWIRFVLVDVENGKAKEIFNAPVGQIGAYRSLQSSHAKIPITIAPQVIWSDDSERVLLVNTAVPPTDKDGGASDVAFIVEYSPRTAFSEFLLPIVDSIAGSEPVLIFAKSIKADGTRLAVDYVNAAGEKIKTREVKLSSPVTNHQVGRTSPLTIVEAKMTPPSVIDSRSGRTVIPAQLFAGVSIAKPEYVDFAFPENRTGRGEICVPPGIPPAQGWPLVIQVYRDLPDKFRPDGPYSSAFATQSLVSAGFMVATVSMNFSLIGTPQEGADFVKSIDAMVDQICARNTVDPGKMGLVGFSRSGFQVSYLAAHPGRHAFAATVSADSFTGNFSEMLNESLQTFTHPSMIELVTRGYASSGGGLNAFWTNPQAWLEGANSFNAHRVRTPQLFMLHSRRYVESNMKELGGATIETIASLAINHRPFEYLFFASGGHELYRPRERIASMEATIDWMCFWLKGEIPKDPKRAARWAILRKQQDEVLKTPPPPNGKWQFVPDPVQPELAAGRGQT